MVTDAWDSGQDYERYVGRWSRKVAAEFVRWLALPPGLAWADVGSGTGALTSTILTMCDPASVRGIDASAGFVTQARQRITAPQALFETGDATRLPWDSAVFDVTVSGLVLNFVPDHESMVREMVRVTKPGGRVAAYVWDYAGGMQMMRHFWDAAIAVSPGDARLDQAERFPLCQPGPLQALFERAHLTSVAVRAIEIPTVFQDFDDFWTPFLGKTGAAPTYLASAGDDVRRRDPAVSRGATWIDAPPTDRADRPGMGGSGSGMTPRAAGLVLGIVVTALAALCLAGGPTPGVAPVTTGPRFSAGRSRTPRNTGHARAIRPGSSTAPPSSSARSVTTTRSSRVGRSVEPSRRRGSIAQPPSRPCATSTRRRP